MPTAEPAKFGSPSKTIPKRKLRKRRSALSICALYLLSSALCGCSMLSSAAWSSKNYVVNKASSATDIVRSKTLHYLGDSELEYYKDIATSIDYTHASQEPDQKAIFSEPPRRIRHPREDEIMDITLAEAIQRALSASDVIRDRGQFLSPGNTILNAPQQANSVFDPGIQETGILLGNRGVEAALADFDANLTINSLWGRNEQVQNSRFSGNGQVPPGSTLMEDSANASAQLQKQMANGSTFSVNHTINYSLNNVNQLNPQLNQQLFGSFYTGLLQAQYRHPLLAGAGVEFNRIAGPTASNPLRVSGVNQGVVIARINNDISVADFESSVRNLLKDVEDLYWELALAYRAYDAEIVARNSNLKVWQTTKVKVELEGKLTRSDQAQAEEAFFDSRSRAEDALARIYSTEGELRRLLGMPVNDGYILRPIDEPSTAEFLPDWHMSLAEAVTNRVEIRRQKWTIKSLELQLKAAHSLVRPRLDFVSAYQVNMFGDTLFSQSDVDVVNTPQGPARTPQGLNSAYETLTQGDQTGWNLGLEFTMPFGFRTANSQVKNLELQLAKARTMLAAQELEISHELGRAFQELDRAYQTAQTNFNRRRAAERRVQAEQVKVDLGLGNEQAASSVDLLLRAQISLAQAEVAYYNSLVAYNQAITAIHYRKGSLLEFNNVALAESGWDPQAYILALRRAWARSHALDADHLLNTEPREFVTGPAEVNLSMPYQELSPLMNTEGAGGGDTPPPAPAPENSNQPNEAPAPNNKKRPYEAPVPVPDTEPKPEPLKIESTDASAWRKSGVLEVPGAPPIFMTPLEPQTTRRPELPLR